MSHLEFRMDPDAVLPLLRHLESLYPELNDELAAPGEPPEQDEVMANLWNAELLGKQRDELAVFAGIFGDEFKESGYARVALERTDQVIRACSALRLKLRLKSLGSIDDELLEGGGLDIESMDEQERVGYAAYILLASLQELIIARVENRAEWGDDEDQDENGGGRL